MSHIIKDWRVSLGIPTNNLMVVAINVRNFMKRNSGIKPKIVTKTVELYLNGNKIAS